MRYIFFILDNHFFWTPIPLLKEFTLIHTYRTNFAQGKWEIYIYISIKRINQDCIPANSNCIFFVFSSVHFTQVIYFFCPEEETCPENLTISVVRIISNFYNFLYSVYWHSIYVLDPTLKRCLVALILSWFLYILVYVENLNELKHKVRVKHMRFSFIFRCFTTSY